MLGSLIATGSDTSESIVLICDILPSGVKPPQKVGMEEGTIESVGKRVGSMEGCKVGFIDGLCESLTVGKRVGCIDGMFEASIEGISVGY